MKDVARAAGVVTGTVLMVLNDDPLVADAAFWKTRADCCSEHNWA